MSINSLKTKLIIALTGTLYSITLLAADPVRPPLDQFGFDWLQPKHAKCVQVTTALLAKFKACEFKTNAGFNGAADVFTCKVGNNSEYMVFKDKSICIDQLETMQAHAP